MGLTCEMIKPKEISEALEKFGFRQVGLEEKVNATVSLNPCTTADLIETSNGLPILEIPSRPFNDCSPLELSKSDNEEFRRNIIPIEKFTNSRLISKTYQMAEYLNLLDFKKLFIGFDEQTVPEWKMRRLYSLLKNKKITLRGINFNHFETLTNETTGFASDSYSSLIMKLKREMTGFNQMINCTTQLHVAIFGHPRLIHKVISQVSQQLHSASRMIKWLIINTSSPTYSNEKTDIVAWNDLLSSALVKSDQNQINLDNFTKNEMQEMTDEHGISTLFIDNPGWTDVYKTYLLSALQNGLQFLRDKLDSENEKLGKLTILGKSYENEVSLMAHRYNNGENADQKPSYIYHGNLHSCYLENQTKEKPVCEKFADFMKHFYENEGNRAIQGRPTHEIKLMFMAKIWDL